MDLNLLLAVVILVFCLILAGLAVIYRRTDGLRNELADRFDSVVQSPDILRKLHALIETMSSDAIVDRLASVEKNLNSQLIALHDQQITLPNTEKLEQLLREAMDVSKNALIQEIASIERKVEKICRTSSAVVESIDGATAAATVATTTTTVSNPSIVTQINDELTNTLKTVLSGLKEDANTNIVVENLRHGALREKLETVYTQLQTLTAQHETVAKNCENVMRLVKDLPLAEELKPLRETIDQLHDKLTNNANTVKAQIETLVGTVEKLSTVGKTTTSNIDKIVAAHEELSRRVSDGSIVLDALKQASDAVKANQRSLHDLLVTRLDAMLDKSSMDKLLNNLTARERSVDGSDSNIAINRLDQLDKRLAEVSEKLPQDLIKRVRESVEMQERLQTLIKDTSKRTDIDTINETLNALNRTTNELKAQITTNDDLDRVYERFVRELDRSEHYISITNKIDATIKSETYELSRAVAKLSDKITVQYDDLAKYVKVAKEQNAATSDSFARIDKQLDELKSIMVDTPKQMAQELTDRRDELLDKIKNNYEIVVNVQKEIRANAKSLTDTLSKLDEHTKATLNQTVDVNARLVKLETRLQSLHDAVPTSTQFWSDMSKLHDMLRSHNKKTDKDLNEMLRVVQNIKSMSDTSLQEFSQKVGMRMDEFAATIDSHKTSMSNKNQELIEMLKALEERIIEKVVNNVRFGNNFKTLRTFLENTIKSESTDTNKLIRACDKRVEANNKILERLGRLSDVDFGKLSNTDSERMLQIMNEVKAQSDSVLERLKKSSESSSSSSSLSSIPDEKMQEIVDRLSHNNQDVDKILTRLDRIADTVNSHGPKFDELVKNNESSDKLLDRLKQDASYININAKLDTILKIVDDYSVVNDVEDGVTLPGLHREFIELRKNIKHGFETTAAEMENKRLNTRQALDGWFNRIKDSINQLHASLNKHSNVGESDIGKHGASINLLIDSLNEKLKNCESNIVNLVNRTDTRESLKGVIDRLTRLDDSIQRIDTTSASINEIVKRLENRPIVDALSSTDLVKFRDSLNQHKQEISSIMSNLRLESLHTDADRLLVSHGEKLAKLLDSITTNLNDSKTGTVGQLITATNTLRQAIKRMDAHKNQLQSTIAADLPPSSSSSTSINDLAKQLKATETNISDRINALLKALISSADDLSKHISIEKIDQLIANVEHIRAKVDVK